MVLNASNSIYGEINTVKVFTYDTSKGTVSGVTKFVYEDKTTSQTYVIPSTLTPITGYKVSSITPSVGSISKVGNDWVLTIPANTTGEITAEVNWTIVLATVNVNLKRDGVAQSGETVIATSIGHTTRTKVTDASGNCTFDDVDAGNWTFTTNNASYDCSSITQTIAVGQTYNLNLTQTILGATVNVNLKRDGSVQSGETVTAVCTGQTTQTKVTDASGNCSFTGLPNGDWTFSTSNASYVCDSVTQTTVAGQTYNINLTQSTVALKVNVKKFGVVEPNATVVLKQGSTTIDTKTTDASGDCQFGSLSPSTTYTVEATCVTTPVFSTTTSVTTGASGLTTLNLGLGNRVGGRIFYVDTTSTGGTYTFYKQDGSQIATSTPPTIAELADAYYYSVSGTPDKDMFYVYDNTNNLATNKQWGKYNTQIGSSGVPPYRTDGLGYGRLNTTACLATTGWESNSIFTYIQSINSANTGGCNDWFVGSEAEQDKLRLSGLVNWYSSNYIWSSVEYSASYAYFWRYLASSWDDRSRDYTDCVVALRAF